MLLTTRQLYQYQVTESPYLYILFYAAYLASELDIRLPFWGYLVAEWRRAYYLIIN